MQRLSTAENWCWDQCFSDSAAPLIAAEMIRPAAGSIKYW
jgi:hypothetical protein